MTQFLPTSTFQAAGFAPFEISLCFIPPLVILGKLEVTERRVLALVTFVLVCCWAFLPSSHPLYSFIFDQRYVLLGVLLAKAGLSMFKRYRRGSQN